MAVRLRLTRVGKKKQPSYRVVAADSRSPRDGRFIEIIGTYAPRAEPSGLRIDGPRALHYLRHGAKPSEAVEKLLRISGVWDVFEGRADESTLAADEADTQPAPEAARAAAQASEEPAPEARASAVAAEPSAGAGPETESGTTEETSEQGEEESGAAP